MKQALAKGWFNCTLRLRIFWIDHRKLLLRIAVVLMSLAAVVWLGYQFYRLLWQPLRIGSYQVHPGAVDLKLFHELAHHWITGVPIYEEMKGAVYPPAFYLIFWPLFGWLEIKSAILLYAFTAVAALAWLVYLVVQQSGANTPLERLFVGLLPLSLYATGATVGNGQVIVHILPMVLAGLLLIDRYQNSWRADLMGSALVAISLVKPSVSAPFFWIVVFKSGRLRPMLLASSGYFALTLAAAGFQKQGLLTLMQRWLARGSYCLGKAGYADVPVWLANVGLQEWIVPASLFVLVLLGCWIYHYRNVDLWLLLGVTAFAARFGTYHNWYDDLLLLLPMIALFRIAIGPGEQGDDLLAGVLLGLMLFFMIAPGGLYLLPPPLNMLYVKGQLLVWIAVLIFLCGRVRKEKTRKHYGNTELYRKIRTRYQKVFR